MKAVQKISSGQLVSLLLAGRLSGCLLFTSESFTSFTLTECLLSTLLNGVFLFLLFLPTLLLLRKGPHGTVQTAYSLGRPVGKIVDGVYLLLCLFVLGMDIVQFSDFAAKTMKTGFSVLILTIAFIITCLLASFYGIQALARCATVVAAFAVVCLAIFTVALIPEMQWLNFPPAQEDSAARILQKAVTDLPRTAEILAIGLLYPYVNRSPIKACAAFSGGTALFSAVVGLTAVAVLGDFSGMTFYPYYTAVTAAESGIFRRMDILVTAVWLGTFFVRFALFCLLLLDAGRRLFGKRSAVPVGVAAFGILTVVAWFIQRGSYTGEWQTITGIYWWILGGICVGLPVILGIGRRLREKS